MLLKLFIAVMTSGLMGVAAAPSEVKLTENQFNEMLKKYQSDLYLSGQIKQEKLIKELDLNLKSEGVFEVNKSTSKGLIIDWHIQKPENLHVCIEGTQIYIKDQMQKKPIQQDLKQTGSQGQESMEALKSLMDMDVPALFKRYTILKYKEVLILKNDKLTVELLVGSNKLMKQIKFIEPHGDVLKIDFINVKIRPQADIKNRKCLDRLDSKTK